MTSLKIVLITIALALSPYGFSQINYQAVVRGANNEPITYNGSVGVEIFQDGAPFYSETHDVNTGELGIVNIAVGLGTNPSGNFNELDWSLDNYEIVLWMDGQNLPASPIRSVPIAEFAKKSLETKWIFNEQDSSLTYSFGYVGINATNPEAPLHIKNMPDVTLIGGGGIILGKSSGRHMAIDQNEIVVKDSIGDPGVLHLQTDDGEVRIRGNQDGAQVVFKNNGRVGIGLQDPLATLHTVTSNGYSQIYLERTGSNAGHSTIGGSANGFYIGHFDNDDDYHLDMKVDHSGLAEVKCLQINGGCDIKEDFNSSQELEPGDVVILDEDNPGELVKSSTSYDKKVAGVISGANGINPGLSLSQADRPSGEFPLAMVGQVYVKATGKVDVGDLLTTSDVAGYAMAVTDFDKSHGSVVGKAMSSQDGGKGFVLLLVNLQ